MSPQIVFTGFVLVVMIVVAFAMAATPQQTISESETSPVYVKQYGSQGLGFGGPGGCVCTYFETKFEEVEPLIADTQWMSI